MNTPLYSQTLGNPPPMPAYPGTSTPPQPIQKTVTIAAAATPAFIGSKDWVFGQIQFQCPATNAGSITIQVVDQDSEDFTDYKTLARGDPPLNWPAAERTMYCGESFKINAAVDGDECLVVVT